MDQRNKLQEQLCISSLSVQLTEYDNVHHFETRDRKIHNSIGYILNGSVEFSMPFGKFTANEGDLIFIPEGIRYISHWDGAPLIRFYSVHFLLPKTTTNIWRSMQPQRLENLPREQLGKLIERMFELSQGTEENHLMTYSLFYQLAASILPHMATNPTRIPPAPLQTAIAYMEENYATISSVQEIATACYLSESRLYHVFKDYLNISPISYLNHLRVHNAMAMLANPDLSIQQIAESLNFHSEYYFRKTFQKITGVLPSHFRKML